MKANSYQLAKFGRATSHPASGGPHLQLVRLARSRSAAPWPLSHLTDPIEMKRAMSSKKLWLTPVCYTSRRSMTEKNSDPTAQGHPVAASIGLHKKSAITKPLSVNGSGVVNPAECEMTQNPQIAPVQITLYPRAPQHNVPHLPSASSSATCVVRGRMIANAASRFQISQT